MPRLARLAASAPVATASTAPAESKIVTSATPTPLKNLRSLIVVLSTFSPASLVLVTPRRRRFPPAPPLCTCVLSRLLLSRLRGAGIPVRIC